jgi:serine/threonine protein kinase
VIGRHISHFYIIRAIGSGGMGVVYEAQDTRLPRSVAIKFLKPSLAADTIAVKRFKREARLSASLNHPNICTILDIEDGEGEPFIAMELLHGISLRRRLETGPSPPRNRRHHGAGRGRVGAAHDHGIMHAIDAGEHLSDRRRLVKLLDFGLATAVVAGWRREPV